MESQTQEAALAQPILFSFRKGHPAFRTMFQSWHKSTRTLLPQENWLQVTSSRQTGARLCPTDQPQRVDARSADFQSAVSQVCNLQIVGKSSVVAVVKALPITNRRYSRLKICATVNTHGASHPLAFRWPYSVTTQPAHQPAAAIKQRISSSMSSGRSTVCAISNRSNSP